jgi:oligopeptide/dipeptide ABC transporter ATP-binding protein
MMTANAKPPLLEVRDLNVTFHTRRGDVPAVRGVDLVVERAGVLGIVGESGSGKSVSMLAVMGLLPPTATVTGSARFDGEQLLARPQRELREYRGTRLAMIFQDPMSALNPVLTIGQQIAEAIRIHDRSVSRTEATDRAVELLELVAIPQPARRVRQYPHEFSGGMRQRAMIAMAMANDPELLIADEPATALDVTVQAQILEVLRMLRDERGVGLALITHDLGVVAGVAETVAVMYAGRIAEEGRVDDVFYHPHHPYTRGLLASLPTLDGQPAALMPIKGTPPSLLELPPGCVFHPRCAHAQDRCRREQPELRPVGPVATSCHFAETIGALPPIQPGIG